MTREEQIKKEACRVSFNRNEISSFITGAKWADEHPNLYNNEKYHTIKVSCLDEFIEKACEWLLHQEEMIGISFEEDFIERFREDMKE